MPKKQRPEKYPYYFTVEGQTEKWYLDWLEYTINAEATKKKLGKQVVIDSKVIIDPTSYVKRATIVEDRIVTQYFDYESPDDQHVKRFQNLLHKMKAAEELYPGVTYKLGYSNYTFDLWIILHKADCSRKLSNRSQYLTHINTAYHTNFTSMDNYKTEKFFRNKILGTLTLDDVRTAISRAEKLEEFNQNNNRKKTYKGYSLYIDNPATSVHESIKTILTKIGL